MALRSRTPESLECYFDSLPDVSLTLLTGTLGCSANWLTARFVTYALQEGDGHGVVLVSWTQDERFWREQLKLAHGADVSRLPGASRFDFIDRLGHALRQTAADPQAEIEDTKKDILATAGRLQEQTGRGALVVLDQPDVLLATHPGMQTSHLANFLLSIRGHTSVHAVVLSCTGDLTRLANRDGQLLPIETSTASFLVQQAHLAEHVLSCRELSTGSARDVSGVLRITYGGAVRSTSEQSRANNFEGRYLVQKDGVVKMV